MDVKDMFAEKSRINFNTVKFYETIICIFSVTFLAGCVHCSYKLEISKETELGDTMEYTFWIQNPYPVSPQFSLIWSKNEPTDESREKWYSEDLKITVMSLGQNGEICSSCSTNQINLLDVDLGFGKNTFRVCIEKGSGQLDVLKNGKANIYLHLYRISDYKLAPAFSHEIYKSSLNSKITNKK